MSGNFDETLAKYKPLIGAMCMTGVIASLMFAGGTNTETFLFFVRGILVPALWQGAVVVMDISMFILIN